MAVESGELCNGEALPFALDTAAAGLELEEALFPAMPIENMTMRRRSVVVATPTGLGVPDGPSQQWQAAPARLGEVETGAAEAFRRR